MSAEPRPSAFSESVSGRVRPAVRADLRTIARVHDASFPRFFLTTLGPAVLRAYYGLVLEYDRGILLVAESEGRLAGFVAGFVDPVRFYRLMSARRWRFAPLVLIQLATHPALLPRLLVNRRRLARPEPIAESLKEDSCELCSIAVHPDLAGRGLGKELTLAFLDAARRRGATSVYLTTDARDNEAVNAVYQRLKFRLARTFEAPGRRLMNEYVLSLQAEGEAHG